MSRHFAPAVVLLLALNMLIGCNASPTFRPTITGRIVDAMQPSGSGLGGVVVTVQAAYTEDADENENPQAPAKKDDRTSVYAGVQAIAISKPDGTFCILGEHQGWGLNAIPRVNGYRVRFRRDDFTDAICDFHYYFWDNKPSLFLDEKQLGIIQLRPKPSRPPSTQPDPNVDVISR